MKGTWSTRVAIIAATLLIVGACTAPAAAPSPSGSASTPRPTGALVTAQPSAPGGLTSDGKILVRWFVGLGTGGNPEQLGAESAAVAKCNAPDGACTKANIKLAIARLRENLLQYRSKIFQRPRLEFCTRYRSRARVPAAAARHVR